MYDIKPWPKACKVFADTTFNKKSFLLNAVSNTHELMQPALHVYFYGEEISEI